MAKLRIVFIIIALLLIATAGAITFGLVPGLTWDSLLNHGSSSTSSSSTSAQSTVGGGTDALVGSWQGSKSLMFGIASAKYTLVARPDGTMTISGTVDAPVVGIENMPFSTEAKWTHPSGTTYIGSIGDESMAFNCDGSKIILTVNPYEAGLVDYDILNMDIELTLTRIK